MIPANTNGVVNSCNENVLPINDNELLKSSKKRIRKRTHKKKNKNIEPVENVIYNMTNCCINLL